MTCSMLTKEILDQDVKYSYCIMSLLLLLIYNVFTVNFEHISHLFLEFLLFNFEHALSFIFLFQTN